MTPKKKIPCLDDTFLAVRQLGGVGVSTEMVYAKLAEMGFTLSAFGCSLHLTALESRGRVNAVGYRPGPNGTLWSVTC